MHVCLTCAGESVLSRIVNWMIETKPIYSVMKMGAMNAMKSTTQKAGIDWDGHVRRMAATPEVSRARHGMAQHDPAEHGTAQHSNRDHCTSQHDTAGCRLDR